MRHYLVDANVLVALYVDEGGRASREAVDFVALRGEGRAFLYVPDIVIIEVLKAFARKCFVEGPSRHSRTSAQAAYEKLREAFLEDFRGSRVLYRYELAQRHVDSAEALCEAAVTHRFRSGAPPSAIDLLILSMGMDLAHVHGRDDFAILTAERPLYDLCAAGGGRLPRAVHLGN